LLESLYYAENGNSALENWGYQLAANLWDGNGFNDAPYKADPSQGYQTSKTALYLIVQVSEKRPVDANLVNALLEMQNSTNGGFYTGYNSVYNHLSTETNTETTALAILALQMYENSLPAIDPPPPVSWVFIGQLTIYVLIILVITGFVWRMLDKKF
ncbi:MAG: hypothetical protein ACRDF4_03230, partial [Rhabdochlamydiaceae bacterium]